MEQWGEKNLKLSDQDWIVSDYCKSTVEDVTVHVLSGMSMMGDGLRAAVHSLYVCNSPFIAALDPNESKNAPLIVEVEGSTVEVEFKVGYFENDD